MDCNNIQKLIEDLIFEENTEHHEKVKKHLASCASCKLFYDEHYSALELMHIIQKAEPIIKDPDSLKNSILDAISTENQTQHGKQSFVKTYGKQIQIFQKFLVAASITLLIIFGFEQSHVVYKQVHLENKLNVRQKNINRSKSLITLISKYPVDERERIKKNLMDKIAANGKENLNEKLAKANMYNIDPEMLKLLFKDKPKVTKTTDQIKQE